MRSIKLVVNLIATAVLSLMLMSGAANAGTGLHSSEPLQGTAAHLNLPLEQSAITGAKTPSAEKFTRYAFKGKKWRKRHKRNKKRRIRRKIRRAIGAAIVTGIVVNQMSKASRGHYQDRGQCYRWQTSCDRGYENACSLFYRRCQ